MKLEGYIFLVFVLTAAVITGSTLGLISNIKYLNQNTDLISIEKENVVGKKQKTDQEVNITNSNKIPDKPYKESSKSPLPEINQKKIEAILVQLDQVSKKDDNEYILKYQQDNNIKTSGILDPMTLITIIEQSKY
ncbi:hypothetical protein SYNTR_1591 [Candidatus Syntrophocurvum alkaliphilum]|uniref:Uncharacterized protein n=1 Tax=Candidatus Syntrophocurvum alkaliphilum TaxID=2293317 RepID=A0A6I6DL48_9FIRM|nr:hypothetical protein [Candidatus Syntrophocurvum alkaliphilum]QGU00185.1 hypothetical protein SYNTR_1591 [Candidatus Syntrophocurvum alkaliphilum]